MKALIRSSLFAAIFSLAVIQSNGQSDYSIDSTGLPGDHFSLEGALELFKNSKSPEDFEKQLNKEENYVNNLDLNQDGKVDYIRVVDNMDGELHAMVLQVPVSKTEVQDIAVIEIEKNGDKSALLQIIGDEDIYGENVIVEPFEEESTGNKGGPSMDEDMVRVVVNVYGWRSVKYVYKPNYVVWVSPWKWLLYPSWWIGWRPYPWRYHHSHRIHYHVGFHRVTTHRVVRAHNVYVPRRKSSTVVRVNNQVTINKYRSDRQVVKKASISTSTKTVRATGPRGGGVSATKTTTTIGAAGANKKAAATKTTTSVQAKGARGNAAAKKTTTTAAAVKGKNAKAAAKKTTTSSSRKSKKGQVKTSKSTKKGAAKKGNSKVGVKKSSTKVRAKKKKNG